MYTEDEVHAYVNINFEIFVQMVAKGKDASDLFPAVVKNVVSKNTEVCNILVCSDLFCHFKFKFMSFVLDFSAVIKLWVCSVLVSAVVCCRALWFSGSLLWLSLGLDLGRDLKRKGLGLAFARPRL